MPALKVIIGTMDMTVPVGSDGRGEFGAVQKMWRGFKMKEKTPSCSIVEVTLSKLGEELRSLEVEVLGAAEATSRQAAGWLRVSSG